MLSFCAVCDCFSTRHAVASDPDFSKDQADSILTWQLDPEEIKLSKFLAVRSRGD